MSGEITRAALEGAQVSITPDCWPCRGEVGRIRVSMTKQTWNGVTTLNRNVIVGPVLEKVDEDIAHTILEMLGTIETQHNWKG